jgi:CRISPR-associated protein Cas5t
MRVLKIELGGTTTSFRYPHFLIGRQPSLPMPPPATIHGHIASTLGKYPGSDDFRFAYTFTHQGSVDDYEHTWLIKPDRSARGWEHPANISANRNPTLREMFFAPQLTLYLDTPHIEIWQKAFLEPRYPVLLGRSQDLASYRSVEIINLEQRDTGYYEHTLLPWSYRPRLRVGQGILMPRWINPDNRREVKWARFVALEHRVFHPKAGEQAKLSEVLTVNAGEETLWVDPTSPLHRERQRILVWHSLHGEESELLEPSAAAV